MKLRILLTAIASFVLWATPANAAFQNWQFDRNQNQLTFTTDIAVQPRALLLFNPSRLVIDLPGIAFQQPRQTQAIGGAIRNIRVAQFDRQTTRIVVELEPGYTLDPQQVQFRGVAANQWTVQLPPPQLLASPAPSGTTPTPTVSDTQIAVPPPASRSLLPIPSATVTIPTPAMPLPRVTNERVVVVIDPGHGGPDPGAVGIGGLKEVDVLMPISLQVAGLLRQQGVEVVLTRETDIDLGLAPRAALANRINATLFVSIHANAISMSRPDVNGAETFYFESGRELAEHIQRNIITETGMRDRGVKRARFYVLRHTRMPSALVEVGFVTGAQDAPRLADPQFRSRMAVAIARGILEYVQRN
ncbi:MAG: N-acetylmuramoyl-L-alanine amidase [Leptolyngbyaceae cyanobacterium bins.349]|nr:N-acetylmuramoyl-L-alanine amidase [Leptolyngbyaceae cyanobacterium bins.349]